MRHAALDRLLVAGLLASQSPDALAANVLHVGANRPIRSIASAVKAASPDTTILVDAGHYPGDVTLIDKDGLTLRASGGKVLVPAAGRAVEGKGIFVVRAERVVIEGFEFRDAAVADRNGAGIRFDRGSLTVRDCAFMDSEAGLLAGNDRQSTLRIENSEFARDGVGDGQTHLLYAGTIKLLTVIGSYFHEGRSGQLIKSRAQRSEILYNRLTDEAGGRASYELEFPNGGQAVVVGNIIQQSSSTENRTMISFGVEGYAWPSNELHLVHNTLDDRRTFNGRYLFVRPGPARAYAYNNLITGGASRIEADMLDEASNFFVDWHQFAQVSREDYRLRADSSVMNKAGPLDGLRQPGLTPEYEYHHPRGTRALSRPAKHPGALQDVAPLQEPRSR